MSKGERYDFGENTTPSWAKESTRDDGTRDVYYGTKDSGDKHGHSVRDSEGNINYSRTMGGNVVKDDSKESSDSSSGWCFVTTACVRSLGLKEDCEELRLLRRFRDDYLAELPSGPALIAEYREAAPRLVAAIDDLGEAAADVYEEAFVSIRKAVTLIRCGALPDALEVYRATMENLRARYLQR